MEENVSVIQNLQYAGCEKEFIENFLKLGEDNNLKEQIKGLRCQRCHLLEEFHAYQKKIDCLDFLICKIKKKNCCN